MHVLTLGLPPATQLALKFHPDKNKAPDAEETFRSIKDAYETLIDSTAREEYDAKARRFF